MGIDIESPRGLCGGGGGPWKFCTYLVLLLEFRSAGVVLDKEKGCTPARLAISCSPSCQCLASAARHGIDVSSATFDDISGLNLRRL